ncbi:hypothetical protein CB1_000309007 [Camelus ferus]|nr:hypothetical protein CB1_000309007 [Camelus ferus]
MQLLQLDPTGGRLRPTCPKPVPQLPWPVITPPPSRGPKCTPRLLGTMSPAPPPPPEVPLTAETGVTANGGAGSPREDGREEGPTNVWRGGRVREGSSQAGSSLQSAASSRCQRSASAETADTLQSDVSEAHEDDIPDSKARAS